MSTHPITINTLLFNQPSSTLRRDLMLAQAKIGEKMQAEDEALETRDIKKRYGELETILRRKTRELDRLNQKGRRNHLIVRVVWFDLISISMCL